jgi:transcriptional repressor NrdR
VQCPYCGGDSQVIDSRNSPEGVRRRRVCNECRRRFTTYEAPRPPGIKVHKRRGGSEVFRPDKIVRVLERVCRGRPSLGLADFQRLARGIEAQLVDQNVKTIRSSEILERLLALLADVDRLAHDRLAADYLDETGQFRPEPPPPPSSEPQLGLFGEDDEEEEE